MTTRLERPTDPYLLAALHTLARRVGLPGPATDVLVDCVRSTVPFGAGREIFGAGDAHDRVYLVVRGAVKLACRGWNRRCVAVQLVEPGGICGVPWSFDAAARRQFRAVAHGPARVATIGREVVERVLAILSPAHRLRLVSHGWRAVSGLLVDRCLDLVRRLDDRLEHRLAVLASAHGVPHGDGRTRIGVRLRSQDLGELVAAAPTSVRHAMIRLRARGRLARCGGYLVVPTPDGPAAPPASCLVRPSHGPRSATVLRARTREVLMGLCASLSLTAEAVDLLVGSARVVWAARGDDLIEGDDVGLVLEGSVRVEVGVPRTGPIVQIVAAGQFVRLTGGNVAFARAVAHEHAAVACFDRATVTAALGRLPASGMLRLFAHSARALSRHLHDRTVLATMPLAARVRLALLGLGRDFGEQSGDGLRLSIRLTHGQLARLAGSSRSAVCRALGRLADERKVAVEDGHFMLPGVAHEVA
ncbi:MAG: cyclic nucleotide-binding domain-containing protein [bacterium]|nr:cyclic nucleotide-binding domain-containing protein [bacterium]